MVYAIALRRLGNHSEAQELCQEVLVKAMQKIEQLKVPAAFGGWLRSITVRMAINRQVRRAPTIATEPQTLDATCVESTTPLDAVLANERAAQVRGGLARLGELDRHTLEAFYVRGESLVANERVVRRADRHDQAPAARRAEAAGAAARNGRGRVKRITSLPWCPGDARMDGPFGRPPFYCARILRTRHRSRMDAFENCFALQCIGQVPIILSRIVRRAQVRRNG